MEPIQVAPFGVMIEVGGAELILLYRNRSQLHAKRAEEMEGRLSDLATKVREQAAANAARAAELANAYLDQIGAAGGPPMPHTMMGAAGNLEYGRMRVEQERRTSDVLAFMASHLDQKKTYCLVEHDVMRLLGPLDGHQIMPQPILGIPAMPGMP
jgi:hypothetical protein